MPAEDIIFYFDLGTRGVVSKKAIVKQVQAFVKAKEKEQPGSNWGIVAFMHDEDNPHFHEGLVQDEDALEPFLKDNLKFVTKAHPLEQGLMLASSYLVDAYRTTRNHTLRMIVISDGPTESSNQLIEALMGLLDTIKHFPVYIDILRVGSERFYPDDVKLKMIAEKTNGKVYYADSDSTFKNIMERELAAVPGSIERTPISIEKRPFFEKLCWSLLETGIPGSTCIECGRGEQAGTVLQCENCGTPYHGTCAAGIAQREYEAFAGIFRCKRCDCLLNTTSRRIVVPVSQASKRAAPPTMQEPVRITIKHGGDVEPAVSPQPAGAREPPAATPVDTPVQPAVSFTVKALQQPGTDRAAVTRPPSLTMKPPAGIRSAPSRVGDDHCEDIKVLGMDDSSLARVSRDACDQIVILDEDSAQKPASFWTRGKA